MKKLAKAMSAFLVICMLMATMTAVTFAAIADGTYWTLATEGDVTIGNSTKVMLLEEVVSGGQGTITEKSGVTFTSSDTSIAEIVDGKIVGKKAGIVKITAEPGFNPNNPKNDKRSMLVVVGNGAESTTNYDTESGSGTESLSGFNNLPYSYVAYPRRGLTGKSLSLDPLEASKASDYGMASSLNYTNKDFNIIQPGKISEIWVRRNPLTMPGGNRYADFVFPGGARMKLQTYGTSSTVINLSAHNQQSQFATLDCGDGWGGGGAFISFHPEKWDQYVIDGSKVDKTTGAGVYTVYINGGNKFTYTATSGSGAMPVSLYRNLTVGGTDTLGWYVDDVKIYELPETVSNTVTVGANGSVTVAGKEYTEGTSTIEGLTSGSTEAMTVTPANGYEIDTITYNGASLDSAATSFVVAKGATLTVSFKKAGATNVAIPDGTYYTIATDGDVTVGNSSKVMLLQEIALGGTGTITEKSGVTFTSSDTTVAEIVNGSIVGKKPGIATITATGFNDGNKNDKRSMMVVVADGAKTVQNYDNETLGSYTETIGAIKNAPYSYVEYPRHGLTGKAYSLDPMPAANATKYGLTATSGLTYVEKNTALSPVAVEAGKITEFWMMHLNGTGAQSAARYIEIVFPDWGRIQFQHYAWGSVWKYGKFRGNGTFTPYDYDGEGGWGTGQFEAMGAGKWNQFVIDGSQADLTNGGLYTVYLNGAVIFTYQAGAKSMDAGFVYTHRTINPSSGVDTTGYFFDDAKTYALPTTVSNNVAVSEGGKVTINGTDYTANGTVSGLYEGSTLNFTVTPAENKVIDKITYNGQGLVNTMTSVTVVKDATLSVTFKDDPAVATPTVSLYTGTPANTQPNETFGFSTHTVYGVMTGWKNIDGYGMKLSDGTEFVLMEGKTDGEPWTWLEESQGRFAFRVYGEGIVGKTCTMTPYITVDGSNTFGEASDEFTGSMAE